MPQVTDYNAMLAVAIEEARTASPKAASPSAQPSFAPTEPSSAVATTAAWQQDDPSIHGETDAFRRAGRQKSYRNLIMVTTLSPCWYCSGLLRQFGFRTVIIGESRNFAGGADWLREKQHQRHRPQLRRVRQDDG